MSPKEILLDLKNNLVVHFGDEIKEVILFGSRAKGTATEDSDYDFLIILKSIPDWKKKSEFSNVCYMTDLKYNIITDTHFLSLSELDTLRGKQPVFANAMKEGIHA